MEIGDHGVNGQIALKIVARDRRIELDYAMIHFLNLGEQIAQVMKQCLSSGITLTIQPSK